MSVRCDNRSVGVLILDEARRFLVSEHTTGRPGIAPVSGHVDHHGSWRAAVAAEVREEAGAEISFAVLLAAGWRDNACRREPGPRGTGHDWQIWVAGISGAPDPSPRETRNMRWVTGRELWRLGARVAAYARYEVPAADYAADPGLAAVWAGFWPTFT